jgi:hypothetical protein
VCQFSVQCGDWFDDRKKGAGRWEALDFGFEFHTPFEDEFE